MLADRVGDERLCLGSDYPFDMADPDPVGSLRAALGDRPGTVERRPGGQPRRAAHPSPVRHGRRAREHGPRGTATTG